MPRGRKYCRLYAEVAEDERANELAESEPLAEVLRLWSLSRCDVYATLDGSPRLYKAQVCPALDVPLNRVATIVDLLVERGFYCRYEVAGETYLWIVKFHEYQDVNWSRVGTPRRPLPDCWVGKDGEDLISLQQVRDQSKTTPGLNDEVTPQVPDKRALSSEGSEGSEGSEREEREPSALLSPVGDGRPKKLLDVPVKAKPKKPPPEQEPDDSTLPPDVKRQAGIFLEAVAERNKSGKIVKSRRRGLLLDIEQLVFGYGAAATLFGLSEINSRGIVSLKYAEKCAANYDPAKAASRTGNRIGITLAKPGEVKTDEYGRQI